MADFVAVIRKAVDGLANNTPENRAKVYDKARSAVVRQLENMKPRPPEELLQRQILKLDNAIAEVEGDYAEALPALEEEQDALPPAPVDVDSPYYEESVAAEQQVEPQDEPQHYHAEEEQQVVAPAYQDEDRVEEQPAPAVHEAHHEAEAESGHEPLREYEADDAADQSREDAQTYFTTANEEPRYAPEPQEPSAPEDHAHHHWMGQDTLNEQQWARQDDDAHHADEELHGGATSEHEPFAASHEREDDVLHDNAEHPYDTGYNSQTGYYGDVHVDTENRDNAGNQNFAIEPSVFEPEQAERKPQDDKPKQAAVEDFSSYFDDAALDLPPKTSPALPRADNDPFGEDAPKKDDKERTPWDDLEELIGYDGSNDRGERNQNEDFNSGFTGEGIPATVYANRKKPRRNYAGIVLGLGALVVLAGGGYALWSNRDALNDMVGGLVNSAQTEGTAETTQTASAPAENTPAPTQPATTGTQTPAATPSFPATNSDGSVTGTKFTQRLMADGTERDEGPAPNANGQPVTAEGQSVYQQNEAPAPQTDAAAPATPAGQAPAAAPAQAATGDRMFLYEEVLGQTVPTAIEGTVSWSLQSEQDEQGRPSPTVQGQITIPGRGLSALLTFKRNTDPSLPASHLVEIVFSVSPGFEGGAIDSVQRIAMKSTEQDRGNALIAVPAKITDDFHMIALNDFPDARRTNLDLLRTRNWIDIPVSYRNGRRALLTLQKGADGKAAFDTALQQWIAAAPADGQ